MRIHWFNPENDLALASGMANYTAPKAARRLHDAGALLPLWYGDSGDRVLCYGVNARWLDKLTEEFDIQVGIFDHSPQPDMIASPWGWSEYARHFFINEGFSDTSVPDIAAVGMMRQLSHRRTASEICRRLHDLLPDIKLANPAVEAFDLADVEEWLRIHPHSYMKQPWSSSGRGVMSTRDISYERALRWAHDCIRRQGSVMLEVGLHKVIDFARLFECRGGICSDIGTSVFDTDKRGVYIGNLLAPECERLAMICRYIDEGVLNIVVSALREVLQQMIAPYYDGIVGVDMLVDAEGVLDATVEVNLRCTMGYVANKIYETYVDPSVRGRFVVAPTCNVCVDNDYSVCQSRLSSGTLKLTPSNPDFTFAAIVNGKNNYGG